MEQSAEQTEIPFSTRLRAYLELIRPANIVTAFADILAGFSAAGGILLFEGMIPTLSPSGVGGLLVSTFGLYGGGVVFNDIFDADLDAEERPERAIPSGRATLVGASILGILLLLIGIWAAFQVGLYSGIIAILIAFCALLYDYWAKHSSFWGPLFMGCCRGGNLLLGCSIIPTMVTELWFLVLVPIIYIGSITLISQGEVHGGSKASGFSALALIIIVTGGLFIFGYLHDYDLLTALPFALLLGVIVIPPFTKAAFSPEPELIKKAVKRGVLSLIILNSAITAGFGGFVFGIVVLALLPISIGLSKLFAVT